MNMKEVSSFWLLKIDQLCDSFESLWRSGQTPELVDYVAQLESDFARVSSEDTMASDLKLDETHASGKGASEDRTFFDLRQQLLRNLICIDVWYREQKNLHQSWDQYRELFPNDSDFISDIESSLAQTTGVGDQAQAGTSLKEFRQLLMKLGEMDLNSRVVHTSVDRFQGSSAVDSTGVSSTLTGFANTLQSISRYRDVKFHAKGGLGVVSFASDETLERTVAIKSIQKKFHGDREAYQRFVNEALITAGLNHPGVVPIYNFGQSDDGTPYYAMRMIAGESLKEAISKFHRTNEEPSSAAGKSLTFRSFVFRDLIQRLVAACNTLHYAHDQHVIHRDLKPANIMLGNYGETIVVDWGIAKRIKPCSLKETQRDVGETDRSETRRDAVNPSTACSDGPLTEAGAVLGTIEYMSPEQAVGDQESITAATDIYSLGATLYEILVGCGPVSATLNKRKLPQFHRQKLLDMVAAGDIFSPQAINPNVPKALDAICSRAMQTVPSLRYASAKDFAQDLEAWLADEAVTALPDSSWARTRRWLRKHPSWSTLLALAPLVLLMLTGIGFVISRSYGKQLEHANQNLNQANRKLEQTIDQLGQTNEKLSDANRDLQQSIAREKSALEAEKLQRQHAERNLDVAKRTNRALNSIFEDVDPQAGIESAAQLRTLLGQNLERLVKEFESADTISPLDSAELKNNLAVSLLGLGNSKLAADLLQEAADIREQALGASHLSTLEVRQNLGVALKEQKQLDAAIRELKFVCESRKSQQGEDALESLMAAEQLAGVLHLSGEISSAVDLLNGVVEKLERHVSLNNAETRTIRRLVSAVNALAAAERDAGNLKRARDLLEQNLPRIRQTFSQNDPMALDAANNLGTLYDDLGEFENAIKQHQFVLERRKELLGNTHPLSLTSENNLATTYLRSKRLDQAVPMLDAVLKKREIVLGSDHPDTTLTRSNLIAAFAQTGRIAEAIPIAEEVCRSLERTLGKKHTSFFVARNNLAVMMRRAGNLEQAFEISKLNYEEIQNVLDPDHFLRLSFQHTLGMGYLQANQPLEAIELLRDCFERRERLLKIEHPDTLNTLGLLVAAYCHAHQVDLACQHQKQLVKLQRKMLPEDSLPWATFLEKVAQDLCLAPAYGEALQLLEESLKIREKLEPNVWSTFRTRSQVGKCYLQLKNLAKAEEHLTAAWKGLETKQNDEPGPSHNDLMETLEGLIHLYREKGDPQQEQFYQRLKAERNR